MQKLPFSHWNVVRLNGARSALERYPGLILSKCGYWSDSVRSPVQRILSLKAGDIEMTVCFPLSSKVVNPCWPIFVPLNMHAFFVWMCFRIFLITVLLCNIIKVHSTVSSISLAMVMPNNRLALDFNIDDYLNRFIPASRLHILPKYVSWFFGYRREPRAPVGALVIWFWAFVGAFCGIAIVEGVYSTAFFKEHGTPLVIASFVCIDLTSAIRLRWEPNKDVGCSSNPWIQHNRFPAVATSKCDLGPNPRIHYWC